MITKARKTNDWGLNDEATELLLDFRTSPRFYYQWLMYANDVLLEDALENKENCSDSLQCMYALKHIRTLLASMQNKDIFDVEEDE